MSNVLKPLETVRQPDQFLYVGMDIHKDNHTACLTNCFGQVLEEEEINNSKKDFDQLVKRVEQLSKTKELKPIFGLEDSYGNGLRLATFLKRQGLEVKIVSPVLVDRERNYETHPEKSDSLDAFGVAKVLIQRIDSLPDYSITPKDELSKEIKELVLDREFLVKEQVRLKNQLHHLLHKSYGSNYRPLFKCIFSIKALNYWRRHPLPKKIWNDGLINHGAVLKSQIRRKVKRLLLIKEEIKEIKQELEILVERTGQKLETMPGCGKILAASVLAEIRNIDRFNSPNSLAKYAGLCPREKSSGKSRKLLKSQSGNRRLNKAIHRIALSQISRYGSQHAKEYFQKKILEGKTKTQSLRCLKRRLCDIIYMMLKYDTEYIYHKVTI